MAEPVATGRVTAAGEPAQGRALRLPIRPAVVLIASAVVALVSWTSIALRLPWIIAVIAMLLAVVVTVWATLSAIVRRSVFVAPLAICLVAALNPAALAGLGSYVERHAGVVSVTLDRGVVLWAKYPGIAGWDAPQDPQAVDTTALAQSVQRALRTAIGTLTTAYGWAWQIGPGDVGVTAIPNGFGGDSLFERIDAPRWTTDAFDGSEEQRAALLAAAEASAAELGLTEVSDPSGDVASGDGSRAWAAEGQTLTLTIEGSHVSLSYTGGPFLSPRTLPGEFETAMRGYEGLPLPPTIVTPELP